MPVSYKIDKEQRWMHSMFWGEVSPADVLSALERASKDPPVLELLVRNEEAEGSNPFSSTRFQKT